MKIIQNEIEYNNILALLQAGTDDVGNTLSMEKVVEYIDSIYNTSIHSDNDALKASIVGHLSDIVTMQAIYENSLRDTFDEIFDLAEHDADTLSSKRNYLDWALSVIAEITESEYLDKNNADVINLIAALDGHKVDLENTRNRVLPLILQELLNAHTAKDKATKDNLLFSNKEFFRYVAEQEKQAEPKTIDPELTNVINAFDKIESAKEGNSVSVASVEEAREISEQGGIVDVAKTVSLKDSKTVSNVIHQNNVEANNAIVKRGWC